MRFEKPALGRYVHACVNHTQKEYARGDVHEHRAECLFSLLKPSLRVFRGVSKGNLPGYIGFIQFLRNFRQRNAFEQAELILQAALDPAIARRAKQGEFVICFDHFDLLQTARNGANSITSVALPRILALCAVSHDATMLRGSSAAIA